MASHSGTERNTAVTTMRQRRKRTRRKRMYRRRWRQGIRSIRRITMRKELGVGGGM